MDYSKSDTTQAITRVNLNSTQVKLQYRSDFKFKLDSESFQLEDSIGLSTGPKRRFEAVTTVTSEMTAAPFCTTAAGSRRV